MHFINPKIVVDKLALVNEFIHDCPKNEYYGLLGGNAGLLLYYYYTASVLPNTNNSNLADALLTQSFEAINDNGGALVGSLYSSGASGFAAVVSYLNKHKYIDYDIATQFSELDEHIFNECLNYIEIDNLDYLHGAIGMLYYFTQREKTDNIIKYINILTEKVCAKAIKADAGIWFPNIGVNGKDKDIINFGLSHGLSGILLVLLEAYSVANNKIEIQHIVEQGLFFMEQHAFPVTVGADEDDDDATLGSIYPFSFHKTEVELTQVNRLAWCYGDLNIALLYYRAGYLFNKHLFIEKGREITFASFARNTYETTLIKDITFCHGYCGLSQLYRAIYQSAYKPEIYEAHKFWMLKLIDTVDETLATKEKKMENIGLLEGFVGVGMVLAGYKKNEPKNEWSKLLLL
jgi:lantibiotic biosynthesis protein